MRSIPAKTVLITLFLIFLCRNAALVPFCISSSACLRPLSFNESVNHDEAIVAGENNSIRSQKTYSAQEFWAYALHLSDERYEALIVEMQSDATEAYLNVLTDMGFVDKFKARYESGSIAAADTPEGYKYHPKFGVFRDIRKDVAEILDLLGVSGCGDERAEALMNQMYYFDSEAAADLVSFRIMVVRALENVGIKLVDTGDIGWVNLHVKCRRVRTWLPFYLTCKGRERAFKKSCKAGLRLDEESFKGLKAKGLFGANAEQLKAAAASPEGITPSLYGEDAFHNYDTFLSEAFWFLLVNCKLREWHFGSEEAYNEFIGELFRYKYEKGEITCWRETGKHEKEGTYFGQTEAEIAALRRRAAEEVLSRINGEYGIASGNLFPVEFLELYGVPHPVQHWSADGDRYINRVYDPLQHTFRAASTLRTAGFRNIECLRLAILLHDVSKARLGLRLGKHWDASEEMIDEVMEGWQIGDLFSEEQLTLVKLLAGTHAEFHNIRMGRANSPPLSIAKRLSVNRPGYEILTPYIAPESVLWMHAEIVRADITTIPSVARHGVKAGQLNEDTMVSEHKKTVIEDTLRKSFQRVVTEILMEECKAALGNPLYKGCLEPILDWLRGSPDEPRTRSERMVLFRKVAGLLSDKAVSPSYLKDCVVNNKMDRILGDFFNCPIGSDDDKESMARFLDLAYNRFVLPREDRLASGKAAVVPGPVVSDFDRCLSDYRLLFNMHEDVIKGVSLLDSNLRASCESLLRKHVSGDIVVSTVGSAERSTFVGLPGYADAELDFVIKIPANMPLDDTDIRSRIPRLIRENLKVNRPLLAYLTRYMNADSRDISEGGGLPRVLPDPICISIKIRNRPFLNFYITRQSDSGARTYNASFDQELRKKAPLERRDCLAGIRMFRYFVRKVLDIRAVRGGSLGRADVLECIALRHGGDFEKIIDWAYNISFDADGRLKDFSDIKPYIYVKGLMDEGNLLEKTSEEEWMRLARSAERFKKIREQGISWTLEQIGGQGYVGGRGFRTLASMNRQWKAQGKSGSDI